MIKRTIAWRSWMTTGIGRNYMAPMWQFCVSHADGLHCHARNTYAEYLSTCTSHWTISCSLLFHSLRTGTQNFFRIFSFHKKLLDPIRLLYITPKNPPFPPQSGRNAKKIIFLKILIGVKKIFYFPELCPWTQNLWVQFWPRKGAPRTSKNGPIGTVFSAFVQIFKIISRYKIKNPKIHP